MDRLALPGWAPAFSWRWGWSGSSGASSRDLILLDSVVLHSTLLIDSAPLPVAVTLNGQQFHAHGQFSYYGAAAWPRLDSLSPASGPADGGTILRAAVTGFTYNLSLIEHDPFSATAPSTSLSAYRCFLGSANITAFLVNETLRCTTVLFASPHFASSSAVGETLPLFLRVRQ